MKHVEAVIRMFEPGYDVRRIAVRRRNRTKACSKRGTLFRAALDALRMGRHVEDIENHLHRGAGDAPWRQRGTPPAAKRNPGSAAGGSSFSL
jgi:hypothetical protein